jgi:hypothetical protein
MSKITTSIKLDEELRDKAKKAGINMSEVIEIALRNAVEGPDSPDRRPERPNMCSCGHGRSRHVSAEGPGNRGNAFIIYKCYECQRWCTTGSLENKGPAVVP